MKRALFAALSLVASMGAVAADDLPSFKLELIDGKVVPQRLEVPAGQKFRVEVRNAGKSAAEFESKALKKEKVIPPGASVVITFNALSAGEYKFVEEFHEKNPEAQGVIVAK